MPLSGLKVLELANILAGPLIGQFCAELGSTVTKVEHPEGGDPTRGWRVAGEADSGVSAYFSCANWGKRSIALNVASDEGANIVRQLVRQSDVVIVGYKPGDEHKFGLDYPTLRELNERLVYLQITAYGAGDARPGFDAIIQAESGFTYLNGEAGGGPVKMPVALVDVLAAHQLKEALLLALMKRERCGEGSYVATSLLAAATASLANQASNYLHAGVVPRRMGSEHPNIVPYGNIIRTADGREIILAVGTERQFREFSAAIGLPALPDDARFATNADRVTNRDDLQVLVRERVESMSSVELETELGIRKVPFGYVNDMPAVFELPASREQLFPGGNGLRTVAFTGDVFERKRLSPPPGLDEHRCEILAELGVLD